MEVCEFSLSTLRNDGDPIVWGEQRAEKDLQIRAAMMID
jgi:hypothetical protein